MRETAGGAARARARPGRSRRRLPAHRRAPSDVRAVVVAVRPDARRAPTRCRRARAAIDEIERDRDDRPVVAELARRRAPSSRSAGRRSPAMALARRGDVRVLAIDAGHHGVVVRAATRAPGRRVRAGADARRRRSPTAAADVVLVEADALDATSDRRRHRLGRAGRGGGLPARRCGASPDVDGVCRRRWSAAIAERVAQQSIDPWTREVETLPPSLVAHVVGPVAATPAAAVRAECEMAPELLRTGVM